MNYKNKLDALRDKFVEKGVDGYIQPREDAFQGEYVRPCDERLFWLTGFDGSAGFAVVSKDEATVLVDGRYTLQVNAQVDTDLYKTDLYTKIHPGECASSMLEPKLKCGIDPKLFTISMAQKLEAYLSKNEIELVYLGCNPIDEIWKDRPDPKHVPYKIYPDDLAGQSSRDKQAAIIEKLKEQKCDAAFISAPDSVAWLLNIRGGDLDMSPLPLVQAILHQDGGVDFLCDLSKVTDEVQNHIGDHVRVIDFDLADTQLASLKGRILVDPKSASVWVKDNLTCEVVEGTDPCVWPKAQKNDVEIQNMREAHIIDGVAVTKFLHWLDTKALDEGADEVSAQEKLHAFRQEHEAFLEPSFDTISGFGSNGAIVHYRASEKTNLKFETDSLYLCDSGGQYLKGTTDITRTVAIGNPTQEMRENYTRVLKGHIGVARAKFPAGTNGTSIDAFARHALWEAGLDFAHGTGHGVGAYLHVHEGPVSISPRSKEPLKEGLILSNEPGYYKEDEYGIRIESLVVVKSTGKGLDGNDFLGFETITLAPLDRKLIVKNILNPEEIEWINAYHHKVYQTLKAHLSGECLKWCEEVSKVL